MNKCIFTGRATADPESRYTPDGRPYATFSLAVDDGFGDNKHTSFFNFIAGGKSAESLAKYVRKGDKLVVTSAARQQEYTTKDGAKRRDISFRLESWEFAQSKSAGGQDGTQAQPAQQAQAPRQQAQPPRQQQRQQAPPQQDFMDIPPGYMDELPFA